MVVLAGCGAVGGEGTTRLESFVGLDGLHQRSADLRSVELGTAEAQAFRRALESAEITNVDEVRAALSFVPSADRRAFAFAVPGCAETSAELTVAHGALTVRLTGGENVRCAQANYFLAVFSLDRGSIPPTPKLSTSPR